MNTEICRLNRTVTSWGDSSRRKQLDITFLCETAEAEHVRIAGDFNRRELANLTRSACNEPPFAQHRPLTMDGIILDPMPENDEASTAETNRPSLPEPRRANLL
jgi:hypothetical protein